jgi:hypothetical protein
MKRFLLSLVATLCFSGLIANTYADSVKMKPVTWKGQKYEYLAEFPSDAPFVHPVRFEEVLDNAGQHGWKLVSVSHEAHFYVFYFMRPLTEDRLPAHRAHLREVKDKRAIENKRKQDIIDEEFEQALYAEEKLAGQLKTNNSLLQQEVTLEKKQNALLQKSLKR